MTAIPTSTEPAPNRLLDLDELGTPEFRSVLRTLDRLVARDQISYLHPSKRWEYPWALQRAELAPGSRVLDVGCGDSIFPVYLASLGHHVTAADLAFTTNLGEIQGFPTEYLRADVTALPMEDGCYDAVFCVSVIEHLSTDEIPRALTELRRVLKPRGRLLLTTDFYEDASAKLWYSGPGRDAFPVDWGFFDPDRLQSLILDAPGWQVDGELDLSVDWAEMRPRMRAYHGYPYTSVGVALVRD